MLACCRRYFSLDNCLRGLDLLVQHLFGMQLKPSPMAEGESWHPDVRKLTLHHETEGAVGHMYAARPHRTLALAAASRARSLAGRAHTRSRQGGLPRPAAAASRLPHRVLDAMCWIRC